MQDVSDKGVTELYEAFNALPGGFLREHDGNELRDLLQTADAEVPDDSERFSGSMLVLGKIANAYGEETFRRALHGEELPPVELDEDAMEVARGGDGDPAWHPEWFANDDVNGGAPMTNAIKAIVDIADRVV